MVENKIHVSYKKGPLVTIEGDFDKEYLVEFIDYDNDDKLFESKNYTNQLFMAWNEVITLKNKARVIEDFKYDRDQGGLVEKSMSAITHIKIHEHKDYTVSA
jgi:hypothetical protein